MQVRGVAGGHLRVLFTCGHGCCVTLPARGQRVRDAGRDEEGLHHAVRPHHLRDVQGRQPQQPADSQVRRAAARSHVDGPNQRSRARVRVRAHACVRASSLHLCDGRVHPRQL